MKVEVVDEATAVPVEEEEAQQWQWVDDDPWPSEMVGQQKLLLLLLLVGNRAGKKRETAAAGIISRTTIPPPPQTVEELLLLLNQQLLEEATTMAEAGAPLPAEITMVHATSNHHDNADNSSSHNKVFYLQLNFYLQKNEQNSIKTKNPPNFRQRQSGKQQQCHC
jgi:hypothetical protein